MPSPYQEEWHRTPQLACVLCPLFTSVVVICLLYLSLSLYTFSYHASSVYFPPFNIVCCLICLIVLKMLFLSHSPSFEQIILPTRTWDVVQCLGTDNAWICQEVDEQAHYLLFFPHIYSIWGPVTCHFEYRRSLMFLAEILWKVNHNSFSIWSCNLKTED